MILSRRQEISNCAARLFRKKGYRATSMRDIAENLGIKASSLYNHISSKEELFSELLLEMAELFTRGMNEITQSGLSTSEKLERLITLHVKLTIENTDAISLVAGEWVHLPEPALTEFKKHRKSYDKEFRKLINDGKKEGLYKEIDTEIILFSTLSTLRGLYSWYTKHKNYNSIEMEKQLIDCLIYGINT